MLMHSGQAVVHIETLQLMHLFSNCGYLMDSCSYLVFISERQQSYLLLFIYFRKAFLHYRISESLKITGGLLAVLWSPCAPVHLYLSSVPAKRKDLSFITITTLKNNKTQKLLS